MKLFKKIRQGFHLQNRLINPKKIVVLFFCFTTFLQPAFCSKKNPINKISVLPVPAFGYTPETRAYFGGVSLFSFKNPDDSLTRTSNAKLELNYTLNKQLIFESDWNIFSTKERWFFRGIAHYSKYPDLYFGIGPHTTSENSINFQANKTILGIDFFRNIIRKLYAGIGLNYTAFRKTEILNGGTVYPELTNKQKIGASLLLLNDSRNSILNPTTGRYIEITNVFNKGERFYAKTILDFRKYASFGDKKQHTLAGRFFQESIIGQPPFFDYALVGGDRNTRGYYTGRFRDKNLTTIQGEYRTRLFWRMGMATFGGVSIVYGEPSSVQPENFKPNAGIGLRFLVDKNENTCLRLDYAIGKEKQSGFYISFGESF